MADRLIAKDTSILKIDTAIDVLALARSWEITSDREEIDVSAIADDFDTTREGSYRWRVNCEKLIEASGVLFDKFLTGGTVSFSCQETSTGKTYSGTARVVSVRHASGGRNAQQLESCVLAGSGALTHAA